MDQLVDRGMVHNVADLYDLRVEDLVQLERMGGKSAANVIRNIDRSRSNPLPRVITALGIRFVGERTAGFLAEAFGSMEGIAHATKETLQLADEVGPKVAEAIVQYFNEPGNRELIGRLRKAGLQFTYAFHASQGGRSAAGQDAGHHRDTAHPEPRRGQAADRAGRRQSLHCREQEDQLRRGGRGRRHQAG